jgi:hypothetical protein
MWVPDLKTFPNHPVTRGVGRFTLLDEWYFNMRWGQNTQTITHILVDTPSDKVRKGPYVYPSGPYDHIVAASGRPETMMWTFERPNGGRSFGFTGGHKHVNWANDNCRKVVLNAILWVAKAPVPENGVESSVSPEELALNMDPKDQAENAPNLTGHWTCRVETGNYTGAPKFDLIHAGQNLLGNYQGALGEAVVFGSVGKNNSVRFSFDVEREGREIPVTYSGQVESSKSMKGKVKFGETAEGSWTGTR